MTKMTMEHESGSRVEVSPSVSMRLALASGYVWVDRRDGCGWQQVVILARREAIRRAVGL